MTIISNLFFKKIFYLYLNDLVVYLLPEFNPLLIINLTRYPPTLQKII